MLAIKVCIKRDIERLDASNVQVQEAENYGNHTRYSLGFLFHTSRCMLKRSQCTKGIRQQGSAHAGSKAGAVPHTELSNLAQRREEAVSTDLQIPETLASIANGV